MSTENCGRRQTVIHTDGACIGNPGPGGYAAVVRRYDDRGALADRAELSGGDAHTTNNRQELRAAIEALRSLTEDDRGHPVTLISDSQIVIKGMSEWLAGWQRRGWKNAEKKPVANKGLWLDLLGVSAGLDITWQWVRGHNGDALNEEVDAMAERAAAIMAA